MTDLLHLKKYINEGIIMDNEIIEAKEDKACEFIKYVLSKIAAIEWGGGINILPNERIYDSPPSLSWRFIYGTDEDVYQKLSGCVSDFQGQLKWIMFRGSGGDMYRNSKINHTIEPEFITKAYNTYGRLKMSEILKSVYKEEVQMALDDVIPLAKHIEKEFGVIDSEPIPLVVKRIVWAREGIEENYLLAYILSKIASIASSEACMFSKHYIYESPPIFRWRYANNTDEEVYRKLNRCVTAFQGQVKWIMHKPEIDGKPGKSYAIEPEFIDKITKRCDYDNMSEILESEYKEELKKAVEDVVHLAEYIEKEFGVENADSTLVKYPKDDV